MGSRKTIEVEVDLDDFDNEELHQELKDRGFEIPNDMDDEEMIDCLEQSGYEVRWIGTTEEILDYKDGVMLNEIIEKFHNSSWIQREEIHKNATKQ